MFFGQLDDHALPTTLQFKPRFTSQTNIIFGITENRSLVLKLNTSASLDQVVSLGQKPRSNMCELLTY